MVVSSRIFEVESYKFDVYLKFDAGRLEFEVGSLLFKILCLKFGGGYLKLDFKVCS